MKVGRSPGSDRERRIRKGGQLLLFVLALVLIVLEATGLVDLSWQAIALFAIVLVVVILNDLEQLEVGEFGSIHLREDIDRAKRRVDALQGRPPTDRPGDDTDDRPAGESVEAGLLAEDDTTHEDDADLEDSSELTARLYDLLEDDPQYALVRLRVELERALEEVDGASRPAEERREQESERRVTDGLEDLLAAHDEVLIVCERAIHTEERLEREEALRVIELGLRVLEHLRCRTRADAETRLEGEAP